MPPARLLRAARRTARIQPFVVMDVLARARQLEAAGRRVIHMEIGEPDFTAPPAVGWPLVTNGYVPESRSKNVPWAPSNRTLPPRSTAWPN